MARRGENIYKRKDNRWEGRYVRCYDVNGKAQIGYVYGKTYREVREKLHRAKSGEAAEKSVKITFSKFCDEWLILSRNRVKESTYVKYYAIVNKHVKPDLGNYAPAAINTIVIENFSNKLLMQEALSTKTVRDILAVLRSILQYMYKQHGGSLNDVEIVYPKDSKKEMRVLSREEQSRFVKYLSNDMDEGKFGVLLALLTGMRIGEICALRWQDIDLETKTITVNSTMQRLKDISEDAVQKTRVIIGDAKSDSSRRVIPLTDYGESLCRSMMHINPQAYVLTGDSNHYLEPRTLQYRLKKYARACNLEEMHFHVLRHTFATRCVEVGFEVKSLSEILGHANTRITLDRYVHSSLELKRANMEKLTSLGF